MANNWGNSIFCGLLFGIGLSFFLGLELYIRFQWLIGHIQKRRWVRNFTDVAERILVILATVVATLLEVWKPQTWREKDESLWWALPTTMGLFTISIGLQILSSRAKEQDRHDVLRLGDTIRRLKKKHEGKMERVKETLRFLFQIKDIIGKKELRFAQLADQEDPISLSQIVDTLGPDNQIRLIVIGIHAFFARRLKANCQLRLGIYARSDQDPSQLIVINSWDGQKDDCFSTKSGEYMKIDGTEGTQSAIVKCFHDSGDGLFIYPNCEKEPDFRFLRPGQERYLKSMVTFKHVFGSDSRKQVLILTLDSSQTRFFKKQEKSQLRTVFVEAMSRIEYEYTVLEVCGKLRVCGDNCL